MGVFNHLELNKLSYKSERITTMHAGCIIYKKDVCRKEGWGGYPLGEGESGGRQRKLLPK